MWGKDSVTHKKTSKVQGDEGGPKSVKKGFRESDEIG